MSEWTDAWNKLPGEIRHIGSMTEAEMRINQLKMEKARVVKFYKNHIKEIDAHIKNLEKWIKDNEIKIPE